MPKSKAMEALITSLDQIKAGPLDEAGIATLQNALLSRYHLAIAKAAKIVANHGWYEGVEELRAAFERLNKNGVDTDPGCIGKTEIIKALSQLKVPESELFIQAIRCKQFEPVWGGKEDTAGSLRAASALALAKHGSSQSLIYIAELLADADIEARAGAALALSAIADDSAIALLRLRALSGEDEPRVLQEIFSSLLSLAPTPELQEEDDTVSFIARFLNSKDADVISVATIALGSSRRLAAFYALRDFAEITFEPSKKRMAFEAIALVRLPEAFDYMIDMIQRGSKTEATLAEESLSIYQGDLGLWNRIQSAKTGTSDDLNSFLDSLL